MSNHKSIIINGVARSGKDTFINFCKEIMINNYVYNISTITPIKDLLKPIIGKNIEKNNKYRKLLSDIKLSLIEYNNYSYNWVIGQINNKVQININNLNIFFIQCREPIEIEKLKIKLSNCSTLLITRSNLNIPDNSSDQNVFDYLYDQTINNDGSLVNLKHKASIFCKTLTF